MKTQPIFSIIICTYNGINRIEKTLKSLVNQSFPLNNYEIIIVDDGSPDDIGHLTEEYNCSVIKHDKNRGIASSRNTGLRHAAGKYVVCIDDDCTVNYDFLAALNEKYMDQNTIGVAANLSHSGKTLSSQYFSSIWYGVAMPKQKKIVTNLYSRLLWYFINSPWTSKRLGYRDGATILDVPAACASYRTNEIRQIDGWDDNLKHSSEDNDITLRLCTYFPNKKIVLALKAEVVHHQNMSFFATLKREITRRESKFIFFKKHGLIPSVFPIPIAICSVSLLFLNFPLVILLAPFFLYPWWTVRFVNERNTTYLAFPYMQFIHETSSNVAILISKLEHL